MVWIDYGKMFERFGVPSGSSDIDRSIAVDWTSSLMSSTGYDSSPSPTGHGESVGGYGRIL